MPSDPSESTDESEPERSPDREQLPGHIGSISVSHNLYMSGLPGLDLLIQTNGEMRVSDLPLWQFAYAEIYFTSVSWPDSWWRDFSMALHVYQQRRQRLGGLDTPLCSGNAF